MHFSPSPLHAQQGRLCILDSRNGDSRSKAKVGRVELDGSNPIDVHPTIGGTAIDIDWVHKKIYWSDRITIKFLSGLGVTFQARTKLCSSNEPSSTALEN